MAAVSKKEASAAPHPKTSRRAAVLKKGGLFGHGPKEEDCSVLETCRHAAILMKNELCGHGPKEEGGRGDALEDV